MKILHDFHIHTSLSLCAKESATVENYYLNAKRLGLQKIGFANHFWDDKIPGEIGKTRFYTPQNLNHIEKIKYEIDKSDHNGIRVYFGCETEYDPKHHAPAITMETAEQMDFILVPNSHTHMVMPKEYLEPYEKHAEFMFKAFEDIIDSPQSRFVTAMAHPFEAVCCPYDNKILFGLISDDRYRRLFDKTANKGIAYEINVSCYKNKTFDEIEKMPQIRLMRIAKECGCKFVFGSDAHTNTAHDYYEGNTGYISDLLELTENDIADIAK